MYKLVKRKIRKKFLKKKIKQISIENCKKGKNKKNTYNS